MARQTQTQTKRRKGNAATSIVAPKSRFNGGWIPRSYQAEKFQRFDQGVRYHFYVWHRRAGKDSFALNLAADQKNKIVGTYWHLFPLHVQAKRAIWRGMDNNGLRFIDQAFPDRIKTYENDMLIEFENGSTWQLTGSDYYDRLVGANVRGAVFSEWALCDPRAWNYVRPIIRENGGWVCFITTFRGRNHAYQMYQRVKDNPEWSCEILTVDNTFNTDGTPVMSEAAIQAERESDMSEAMIQQEYYCNPLAAAEGSIYGSAIAKLLANKTTAEYNPLKPVTACWALKYLPVNVSVVFSQDKNIIGSRSWMFETLPTCLAETKHAFPWRVAEHVTMDCTPDIASNFYDSGIDVRAVVTPEYARVTQLTAALIETANIDTEVRRFEPEGNNLLLVESLNGYSARETNLNNWSMSGVSEFHYLARAFETLAVWNHFNPTVEQWGRKTDYTLQDRSVI